MTQYEPPSTPASFSVFDMRALDDEVAPVAPGPPPTEAAPPPPPPPPTAPRYERPDTTLPEAVLVGMARDLAEEHPSTRWGVRNSPMHMGLELYVESLDRLTGEVVGKARGGVSLTRLIMAGGVRGVADDIQKEVDRMIALLPSGL